MGPNVTTAIIVALLLLTLAAAVAEGADEGGANAPPEVETPYGRVRGVWMRTERGAEIAGFLGLPYAEPPLGELRFENPRPWTKKWEGARDASQDGSMCMQVKGTEVVGDEDCLYLNVFTPTITKDKKRLIEQKLPVLFFVHGGAFNENSSNSTLLAPTYLLDHEIVVVTINHRLNILGFFSTGNAVTPGNYGLKDVAEALRWVSRNIAAFGGDPSAVTAAGYSSGAASVQLLSASPSTEGLFGKLITMSGSAIAPYSFHSRADIRNSSLLVARLLGCTDDEDDEVEQDLVDDGYFADGDAGSGEVASEATTRPKNSTTTERIEYTPEELDRRMVECVKRANASEVVARAAYRAWHQEPRCVFGPTLEPEAEGAVLTLHPEQSLAEGLFRDMPWINGMTRDEGLIKTTDLFLDPELADEFLALHETLLVPYELELWQRIDNVSAATEAVVDFYFNGDVRTNFMANITQCVGDAILAWPSYDMLQKQLRYRKSDAFFYVFSYEGTFSNTFRDDTPYHFGASHGDDVNYLFPILNAQYADLQLFNNLDDRTMINVMCEMWVSFAKTGVPSARLTTSWEPYQAHRRFMRLGRGRQYELSMVDEQAEDALPERMAFWTELAGKYGKPLGEVRVVVEEEEGEEVQSGGGSVGGATAAATTVNGSGAAAKVVGAVTGGLVLWVWTATRC